MIILSKGTVLENYIGAASGITWNIDNDGATVIVRVERDMLQQYKLGGHYDFACVPIKDTLFFCVKWGDNDWISAPFSPHLSGSFKTSVYEKGKGMPLTVLLVCTDNGVIEDMDLMGLGTDFSNEISSISKALLSENFDINKYRNTIETVYQEFESDEELANISEIKYSID